MGYHRAMLMFFASMAHAACTFNASLDLLESNIQAAQTAYVGLDVGEFQRAMTEVDYLLPCLTEPVSPQLAAELHRIRAIGQYVDGKREAVAASLSAARSLEPDYSFSTDVLPEGFELRLMYEATVPSTEGSRLPRPGRDTTLYIDGSAARLRPDRAALLQIAGASGVSDSHYLLPAEPLPDYPGVDRRRNTLLTSALITGAASLTLYGGAWISDQSLKGVANSEELDRTATRTNLLTAGSGVLLAGSLAQLGVLVASGRKP